MLTPIGRRRSNSINRLTCRHADARYEDFKPAGTAGVPHVPLDLQQLVTTILQRRHPSIRSETNQPTLLAAAAGNFQIKWKFKQNQIGITCTPYVGTCHTCQSWAASAS